MGIADRFCLIKPLFEELDLPNGYPARGLHTGFQSVALLQRARNLMNALGKKDSSIAALLGMTGVNGGHSLPGVSHA